MPFPDCTHKRGRPAHIRKCSRFVEAVPPGGRGYNAAFMSTPALPAGDGGSRVALDTRVRLWTVAMLVVAGTSGLALIRDFLSRIEAVPPGWRSFAAFGVGATLAVGTLLLLLLVVFWRRLEERHLAAAAAGLGLLLVLAPAAAKTAGRLVLGPTHMVLDAILQVEVAADLLAEGRNPYREDFFGTDLERWHEGRDRFPLHHMVYPPVPLVLTLPARMLSRAALGVYDSRFLLIPAWIASFLICLKAWRGQPWRPFLLTVAFLNPLILADLHVGRWDTLVLLLWVLAAAAWARGRPLWTACALGAMAGVKLTLLAAGVFAVLALAGEKRDVRRWIAVAAAAFLLPLLPFLLWDPAALWEDLVTAPLGLAGHPSRIIDAGAYGGGWLVRLLGGSSSSPGILPGWIIQGPVTLAVALMAAREVRARRTQASFGLATALTLATFFYFGSYSDPSYIGFLLSMAAVSFGFDGRPTSSPAGAAA
jgi:hypothetical protein